MIKSNNVDRIVSATIEIQKAKDTSMLYAILYKPDDPRITQLAFCLSNKNDCFKTVNWNYSI
jgi:hypothetical protein